ncbi:TIGR02444 family protein [Vibrio hibernica]|uniref:TIGR02444 family protein n=1 Tax=Vibrio hibernica TaxID=2587465 RepID=UPI0039AFFC5B
MPTPSLFPLTRERLWQFSLQHYHTQGVKEACLQLQNNHQGNVNLILLLILLDEYQITLASADQHQLQQALQCSEVLLTQFRDLRRRYKSHLPDTLYRDSLKFELQLEHQQQGDLVKCINSLIVRPRTEQDLPLSHQYCQQLKAEHLCTLFFQNNN